MMQPSCAEYRTSIGTAEVTQLVANLSAIYSPELHVGYTPACCSDHQVRIEFCPNICAECTALQSFHEQGFPATQVFERAGYIADPMYHNSGAQFYITLAVIEFLTSPTQAT